jgi:hypothetical protein
LNGNSDSLTELKGQVLFEPFIKVVQMTNLIVMVVVFADGNNQTPG